MSSLEKSTKRPTERYLLMKPIAWQKSTQNIGAKQQNTLIFKPVIKPLAVKMDTAKTPPRKLSTDSYEFLSMPTFYKEPTVSSESSTCEKSSIKRYHCVDEYVQMTEPKISTTTATVISPSSSSSPPLKLTTASPHVSLNNNTQAKQKAPLPSPRSPRNFALGDYANINSISPTKYTITLHTAFIDANNNNTKQHSPTPEFPPPSVVEAERTILGFMQPISKKNKRRSIQLQDNENKDLESYIMEHINKFESSESPHSSRISDCVEEFVADRPFAGLFKGSALNLYSAERMETNPLEQQPACLRSPSLVRSIKPIAATRRKQSAALTHQSQKQEEEVIVTEDLNEAKVWDEINSILKTIDNEVLNADKAESYVNSNNKTAVAKQKLQLPAASSTMKNVHLRNPADLRLGDSNDTATTNWCHSPNTLIYGQIMYTVYYLGSTVIKELHGEASTRKSIQKLKREDNVTLEKELEVSLLDDCNNSTKYLKTNNQQQRLKVDIVISHNGVKFIDSTNQCNICIHAIENINCVCQDAEDMRYFAYITREQDIHYCHVFMVDSLEKAKEIILTLGQTFEVAYQLALNKQKSPLLEAANEEEDCTFNFCALPEN